MNRGGIPPQTLFLSLSQGHSGEVETPENTFFPGLTLDPSLGSNGKIGSKNNKLQPTREEGGLDDSCVYLE